MSQLKTWLLRVESVVHVRANTIIGAKLEQDLAATIRSQRLLDRVLALVERVHMLHGDRESDPSVTRSPSLWYISWIAVRGALRSQLASQNPWRLRPDGSLTTIGKHKPRTLSMQRFSIGSSRPVASRFTKDKFRDENRTAVQVGTAASSFVSIGELFLRS